MSQKWASLAALALSLGWSSAALPQHSATGNAHGFFQVYGATQSWTNQDIIRLAQAGIPEGALIMQIKIRAGDYSLGANDLVRLRQAGVSDGVIAAMKAKMQLAGPATADHALAGSGGDATNSAVAGPAQAAAQETQADKTATAPQLTPPFPSLGVLDAEAYRQMTDPNTILTLQFMRLSPRALRDGNVLLDFACLNNANESNLAVHYNNEFERATVVDFYRSHAMEILTRVPDTLIVGSQIELGEYDMKRQAFPVITRLAEIDGEYKFLGLPEDTKQYQMQACAHPYFVVPHSPVLPIYRGGPVDLELDYKVPVSRYIPMNEKAAQHFVEALNGASRRIVWLVMKIQLQEQEPKVIMPFGATNGRVSIKFAGDVKSAGLYDRPPDKNAPQGQLLFSLTQ